MSRVRYPFAGLLALLAPFAAGTADAEDLTIALSTEQVAITSNFSGQDITVFGVIEDGRAPSTEYDLAVTLRGPAQNVAVRRKDRVVGVWINRASETVLASPAYYWLQASGVLADIATPEVQQAQLLGIDNLGLVFRGRIVVNDPSAVEFRDAFLRLKQEQGLYGESDNVGFIGETVFRTTFALPANVPVGRYIATVYLLDDGELVARARQGLDVARVGGERVLYELSRNQALIYGLLTIILALFVGWLGGVLFRRD